MRPLHQLISCAAVIIFDWNSQINSAWHLRPNVTLAQSAAAQQILRSPRVCVCGKMSIRSGQPAIYTNYYIYTRTHLATWVTERTDFTQHTHLPGASHAMELLTTRQHGDSVARKCLWWVFPIYTCTIKRTRNGTVKGAPTATYTCRSSSTADINAHSHISHQRLALVTNAKWRNAILNVNTTIAIPIACHNIFSVCVVDRHLYAISVPFHLLSPEPSFRFRMYAGVSGFVMSFAELRSRIHLLLYIAIAAICHKSFYLPPALYVILSALFLLLFYFHFYLSLFAHSLFFHIHSLLCFTTMPHWTQHCTGALSFYSHSKLFMPFAWSHISDAWVDE